MIKNFRNLLNKKGAGNLDAVIIIVIGLLVGALLLVMGSKLKSSGTKAVNDTDNMSKVANGVTINASGY